ncbi:MAG: chalcone isomerase family protein [Dokdonella sp.]
MRFRSLLLALTSGLAAAMSFSAVFAAEPEGEATGTAAVSQRLPLAGQATYQYHFVPFYVATLRLPATRHGDQDLSDGLTAYQLDLVWQPTQLDAAKVRAYWRDELQSATAPDTYFRIGPRVEHFLALLPAVKHGDAWSFSYEPDAGLFFFVDGKSVGRLTGIEFNRSLLAVWVGENADPDARAALLGLARTDTNAAYAISP